MVCSAIIDLTSISYSVDSHFILISSELISLIFQMARCLLSSRRSCLSQSWDKRSPSESPFERKRWYCTNIAKSTFWRWKNSLDPLQRIRQNIPKHANESRRLCSNRAWAERHRLDKSLSWRRKFIAMVKTCFQLILPASPIGSFFPKPPESEWMMST